LGEKVKTSVAGGREGGGGGGGKVLGDMWHPQALKSRHLRHGGLG